MISTERLTYYVIYAVMFYFMPDQLCVLYA